MSKWIPVISADKVLLGQFEVVNVNATSLVVANSGGCYFAVENLCTHDGGELTGGELEGEEVICPRHGAGFCLKTGAVTRPPAHEDIRHFPLRLRNGYIEVEL